MSEPNKLENPSPRRSFLGGDPVIWIVFFLLCAISLVEVYSSTSSLSYKTGRYWDAAVKHGLFIVGGFFVAWMAHCLPCRWYKLYPLFVGPISIILLLIVLMGGGSMVNGAHRVISILGINIQPSELAKGAVVLGTAIILSAMQTPKGADKRAFRYVLVITVGVCLLIAPENFSTAALLFAVVFLMMFIGRIPWRQLGKLLGVLALLGGFVGFMMFTMPESFLANVPKGHRLVTWKHRIMQFSPANEDGKTKVISAEDYNLAENVQVANANIAIAKSNVVGRLPGNSAQRDHLPQAYSDFIYAIIIEEMGIVGGIFVALLYIILLIRAGKIARRCERNFPAFTVIGLALLIVVQAMVNLGVAVGLFPVTGQPLPLISRGGASFLVNCIYIGMILSVSRYAKRREETALSTATVSPEELEFQKTEGME